MNLKTFQQSELKRFEDLMMGNPDDNEILNFILSEIYEKKKRDRKKIEELLTLKIIKSNDSNWEKHQKAGFNEAITQVQEILTDGKTIYENI